VVRYDCFAITHHERHRIEGYGTSFERYIMSLSYSFYFNVFRQLLAAEFIVFKANFKDKIIDLFIWVGITAAIMGYVMPAFGLAADYGVFQLAGLVASGGLFEVFPSVMNLVSDFEGDKQIDYQLILPVPSWLIMVKTATFYALNAIILGVSVIPMGKLVLWYQFDLTKINIIQTIAIIIAISIFYGFFTLWLASRLENTLKIGSVWCRVIFPLWFLGGFQFSWMVLHKLFPTFAYVNLINPMTYIMEGIRGALLGQEGYLNVWLCALALAGFSLVFGLDSIRRLKKRLDYV